MIILGTNSIKDTGYDVANSVRLNDGSSDSLNKTFGTPTNNLIWSFSTWIKRSTLGTQNIFSAYTDGNNFGMISFNANDAVDVASYIGGFEMRYITNRVFRDVSAFYHLCITNNSSLSSPETKIYINGVLETSFGTSNAASQNEESMINKSGVAHWVGQNGNNQSYVDGYLAETVFLDGTAAAVTEFGEFDEDSGIWKPIDVSGLTFGTNGFYLDFEDSAALGDDVSGNGNDFTVNNLTAIDQSTDTCTNNFATMNPLHSGAVTFAEGNLQVSRSGSGQSWLNSLSTFAPTSGKWYVEIKVNSVGSNGLNMGFANFDLSNLQNVTTGPGEDATSAGLYSNNGPIFYASGTTFATTGTPGGIVQLAMDLDNGYLYWGDDNTYLNSGNPASGSSGTGGLALSNLSTGGSYGIAVAARNGGDVSFNFGSPPFSISSGNTDGDGFGNFEYAPPSGYFALCTKNLAEYG